MSSQEQFDHMDDMVQRLLDDQLSPEEHQELPSLLANDDAARRQYIRLMHQQLTLSRLIGQSATDCGEHAESQHESLASSLPTAIHWRKHPGRFVAVAAVLTVFFLSAFFALVWPWPEEKEIAQGPAEKITPTVAQLVRVVDAEWEGVAPNPGEALKEGRQLKLKSGLAQIRFSDGASVILEGPAVFTAATANSGRLVRGSLVASCETERARGFTIATPHGRVEDIGTRFAVDVREDGAAEFFVLSGLVVVTSTGGGDEQDPPRMQLSKGQAASVPAGGGRIASQGNVDLQRLAEYRERIERISKPSNKPESTTGNMGIRMSASAPTTDVAICQVSADGGTPFRYQRPAGQDRNPRDAGQSFLVHSAGLVLDTITVRIDTLTDNSFDSQAVKLEIFTLADGADFDPDRSVAIENGILPDDMKAAVDAGKSYITFDITDVTLNPRQQYGFLLTHKSEQTANLLLAAKTNSPYKDGIGIMREQRGAAGDNYQEATVWTGASAPGDLEFYLQGHTSSD